MRTLPLLPVLAAALLGFCLPSESAQAAHTPAGTATPQRNAVLYTSLAAAPAARREIVPVRIDSQFTADERDKIVAAVRQWNHVLNGLIRFEVSPLPYNVNAPGSAGAKQANTWIVARVSGTGAMPAGVMPGRGPQLGMTLAQTQTLATDGGMVVVFADKVGQRDLTGIMMHEFGHVLGLGHENAGRLMSAHYAGTNQQCIDRGAAQAVAHIKALSFEALNWCGDAAQVAAAGRGHGQVHAQVASR